MRVYKKDGIKYLFSSKYEIFNEPYGISAIDKKDIDTKILNTLNFYKNSYIEINGEKQISFFDFSTSANIQSSRYHAELYNRIKTMREFADELGFDTPIFITLTAPSYLKPLKQVKLGKSKNIKLVDNPKFCGDLNFVKLARDYIANSWRSFLRQRIFKDIKNEFHQNIMYLKVFEPHLDGCPHCHIVAFVPSKFKDRFVNLAQNYFKTKTDIKSEFDDNGGGVIAYLLKYVLKSFKNGKNGELCDIAYWYIKYEIRRFSTSRTLIPMYLYRKIRHNLEMQDLKQMTNLFRDGFVSCDLIADNNKFSLGEKLKSTDYIIDTIIVSIDGFDYLEHKIAYKRSDNVVVHLASGDERIINRGNSRINPFEFENIKNADFSKIIHYNPYKIFRTSWENMSDERLKRYYKDNKYWISDDCHSIIDFAKLENEMIERGFLQRFKNHIEPFKDDFELLQNEFANRGLIPFPF